MQQAGRTGLILALGVLGWASQVSAQEQTQLPATVPQGAPPMFLPPVTAPGFEPAPVPSRPLSSSTAATPPAAASGELAPGSARLRLNGRVTTTIGSYSDSGRAGR